MKRLAIVLLLSLPVFAQDISLPHNLSNNSVADANEVMENFNALKDGINDSLQTYGDYSNVVVGNGLRLITPGAPFNYSGKYNSAIGFGALFSNTEGGTNTAAGYGALGGNTSGYENTAMGYLTLGFNQSGDFNTAFGLEALMRSQGWDNTAVGRRALHSVISGSSNTAVGSKADVDAENLSNATAIGFGAIVDATNKIQLGNAAVTAVATSGKLTTGEVTYPNVDGTAGQLLATDGAGNVQWSGASLTPTWVDANGEVVGYPNNTPGSGWTTQNTITVRLPETDMVFMPSYTFGSGTRAVQYLGGAALAFPATGCNGEPVLWGQNQNGQSAAPFGVTMDGYYAYAGEPGVGEFARASYTKVDQYTGAITCVNGTGNIMYSEAIISSKQYAVPLVEPVILRWR